MPKRTVDIVEVSPRDGLQGESATIATADKIELINRAVAPEALAEETRALAQTVAGKLGAAVRIGKRAFYDQLDMGIDDAYRHTGAVMVENMLYRDTEEGIAAFIDKRPPDWQQ